MAPMYRCAELNSDGPKADLMCSRFLPMMVTAVINGRQPVALSEADRSSTPPTADTCPGRDGVDAQPATAAAVHLVADEPQDRELPGGEISPPD
jgi:hypothetical protein